jgi:hypothetical protein
MFKYRLYLEDGTEVGEAEYAVTIKPGEIVWALGNRKLRVLDVVAVGEEDSPYTGLHKVEAA